MPLTTTAQLLQKAANTLRIYEQNHRAKITPLLSLEDQEISARKADTNAALADEFETHLASLVAAETVRLPDDLLDNRPGDKQDLGQFERLVELQTFSEARHADLVANLQKTGEAILKTLTPHQADLLHMAIGAQSESGELADAIKRYAIYNKPLDRTNVVEELGDLEFFMEGIRRRTGITRDETLDANFHKLEERYQGEYSDQAAIFRADKQPKALVRGDVGFCEPSARDPLGMGL